LRAITTERVARGLGAGRSPGTCAPDPTVVIATIPTIARRRMKAPVGVES
jgi:hypothetical protein